MNWKTRLAALLMALSSSVATAQANSRPSSAAPITREAESPETRVIAGWNFNQLDASITGSPPPSTGTGQAANIGGTISSYAAGAGSSDPAAEGDGAWSLAMFPAQGTRRLAAGAEFRIDTTGYRGVSVRFDFRASNTASRRIVVQASTDGTSFVEAARFDITTGSTFRNGLTADLSGIPGTANNRQLVIRIVSDFADETKYLAVSGNYGISGTWRLDMVSVSGSMDAPLVTVPSIRRVSGPIKALAGESISLTVLAAGTEPLHYAWYRGDKNIPGTDSPTYSITNASTDQSGHYHVEVSNPAGTARSDPIVVVVLEPDTPVVVSPPGEKEDPPVDPSDPTRPPIPDPVDPVDPVIAGPTNQVPVLVVDRIAHLRSGTDPMSFPLPNTDASKPRLVQVTGIVSARLGSPANPLVFIQDDSGGVAVRGGGAELGPGNRVSVVGLLTQTRGLLVLDANPEPPLGSSDPLPGITLLDKDQPVLPAATLSPHGLGQGALDQLEALEARWILLTNVMFLGADKATFETGWIGTLIDRAGSTFAFGVDELSDLPGRTRPTEWFQVAGILVQDAPSEPWSTGYRLVPARFADIQVRTSPPSVHTAIQIRPTMRPGDASDERDTSFALQAGEAIRIQLRILESDSGAYELRVRSPQDWPAGSGWSWIPVGPQRGTTELEFVLEPRAKDQGHRWPVELELAYHEEVQVLRWDVYVPTAAESRVVLTEYLNVPSSKPGQPGWNPLGRSQLTDQPERDDEFIELVNFAATQVDLADWQVVVDGTLRHRFPAATSLASSNVVVLFGGGPGITHPDRGASFIPVDDAKTGLGLLDKGGRVELYNGATNLVLRLAYQGSSANPGRSRSRYPVPNGSFSLASPATSPPSTPGRRTDGSPFPELGVEPPTPSNPDPDPPAKPEWIVLSARREETAAAIRLAWSSRVGSTYSVWSAETLLGPFERIATGLVAGTFLHSPPPGHSHEFLRISSP